MYAKNATGGQWKAHGRYIARESASQGPAAEAGFDATERGINIVARLDQWQYAGYERLWKLILSPEFGDKMDLIRLTRDLTKRMARDLDTRLEWVAVSHFNTDNPHVHIALRGVRADGKPLRLERDYVKHGIRSIAEDLCTLQLGYRTQSDVAQAQRREVSQQRFTSLDRAIARDKPIDGQSSHFPVSRNPAQPKNQDVIERTDWSPVIGSTDSTGRWSTSGQFEKSDFGDWSEIWTVGDKLASPAIRFSVNAPCLPGGQGHSFNSGPNIVLSCETAEGRRTFVTPSLSDPFRTPDGRLVPGRPTEETPSQYHMQVIQDLIASGKEMRVEQISLQSSQGGLGDETADLISKLIGVNALNENETRNSLAILRAAFAKPETIQPSAKDPSRTLLLLGHLADFTDQDSLKREIAETIAYVQAR